MLVSCAARLHFTARAQHTTSFVDRGQEPTRILSSISFQLRVHCLHQNISSKLKACSFTPVQHDRRITEHRHRYASSGHSTMNQSLPVFQTLPSAVDWPRFLPWWLTKLAPQCPLRAVVMFADEQIPLWILSTRSQDDR